MAPTSSAPRSWRAPALAALCLAAGIIVGKGLFSPSSAAVDFPYGNTETMYAANGKAYEVPVRSVWDRYRSGKLGIDERKNYEIWNPETSTYQTVTGEQLAKLYKPKLHLFVCPYEVKGHPNEKAPPNLAPPDELLPLEP